MEFVLERSYGPSANMGVFPKPGPAWVFLSPSQYTRIGPSALDATGRSELISHLAGARSLDSRHRCDVTPGSDAVATVKKVISPWPTLSESP